MNTNLAEKLLSKILEWTEEEVRLERPLLQAISNFKYDEYQQFSPGIRFIESLVRWLKQFELIEEKRTAYEFVKNNLIFISNEQVSHLVNLAYNDKVKPILIKKTASGLELNQYLIKSIVDSELFSSNKRRALYLGLSDGAKIDLFRRSSGISNEQVYPTYQVSQEKAEDFQKELKRDTNNYETFNTLFLIDDFTASGRSYWRSEQGQGKVLKLFKSIFGENNEDKNYVNSLIEVNSLTIHIIFYMATDLAKSYLEQSILSWKQENKVEFKFTIEVIQLIDNSVKETVTTNKDFIRIAKKYYDNSIEDRHYKEGKHDLPYLGFNECGLPLILNHNTPNNSLPIFWFPDDKDYIGLFPRVTRHKE